MNVWATGSLSRALVGGGAAVLVTASVGCSSASIRGGAVVAPRDEPKGEALGTFRVKDCGDARGGKIEGPPSVVRLLRQAVNGGVVLVEARDRDVLVVDNVREDGAMRVFQAILERKSGSKVLREYKVPVDRAGQGTFATARNYELQSRDGGFVASYAEPTMVCALLPDAPLGDIPAAP